MYSDMKYKSRLSIRVVVIVLVCSSLLTLLATAFQLYFDYQKDVKSIHSNISLIRDSYLPAIISSVYTLDVEQVQILLEGSLNIIDIEYIEIEGTSKNLFKPAGNPAASRDVTNIFPLIFTTPSGKTMSLGTLKVSASLEGVYQRLWEKTVVILLSNMVKTFVAAILYLIIINHIVIRHLRKISNFTSHLKPEDLDQELALDRKISELTKSDELSQVVSSLNDMQARIRDDISKRERAEKSLKVSNERYYQVTTNLPGLVYQFVVHVDGSYSMPYVSDGVKSMFGVSADDVNQDINLLLQFIHPDDVTDFDHSIRKATLSLSPFNHEFRTLINGDLVWVNALSRPKELSNGDVSWDGILLDISGRKRAEEKNTKLEIRLQQAQKMEAIGTLAGGIAHDFNNILAAILGYAELAREDCLPKSTVAKDLDQVLEAGHRAKDLVQQILAFSRQAEMERIPLQPLIVVKEAINMLRPSLPTTIEINQNITSATGLILADPTQIHQILMNLCTNAFHAMEDTGGKLDISLQEVTLSPEDLVHEPDVTNGAFIQLSIADSGTGIAPAVKDKIFDPYFTTKETGKGTGMGLSMVHGIVKNYGGFISLYSELGEGTVFHVFLPVIEKEAFAEDEADGLIPTGRERILFVDDEEILTKMGKTMLERLGYHVTVRNSSLDALETFQNQPDTFDIVITDQTMPGMTGGDLSRRMLQIRHDIPIILCTGYSTIISEEKAKSMGIKEFALKPLAKNDIAKLIRKILDVS
jgi:PAS domain S-box-containing protein